MKNTCPYTFALRSRAAIIEYITDRAPHDGFPLVWNIKVYSFDDSGRIADGETVSPLLDQAWTAYLETADMLFYDACEDALRMYLDDEYTSYPGDDQGDWSFTVTGRSGGWLALDKWQGYRLTNRYELAEALDEMSYKELRAFYKGIVCLDSDLAAGKPALELAYQYNFRRAEWEEGQVLDPHGLTPFAGRAAAAY